LWFAEQQVASFRPKTQIADNDSLTNCCEEETNNAARPSDNTMQIPPIKLKKKNF
jgi:hypothetical protein